MKAWLKLLADTLYSKLPDVGYSRSDTIPAGHVGGATAFAVTVTGVATVLPLAGAVIVTIPFEVEADASEASRKRLSTINFIEAPGAKTLPCPGNLRAGVWPIESPSRHAERRNRGRQQLSIRRHFRRSECQVSCTVLRAKTLKRASCAKFKRYVQAYARSTSKTKRTAAEDKDESRRRM